MKIVNRDNHIPGAPTFKLIAYKVQIDKIWKTPNKGIGSDIEFKFAWQTSWWDNSTDVRGGVDPTDKRVYAYNNYYEANINDDVRIHATFTDYDPELFRAEVPRRAMPDSYQQDIQAMMTLQYIDIENIVDTSYSVDFKRKVYKDQISMDLPDWQPNMLSDFTWISDDTQWKDKKEDIIEAVLSGENF